MYYLSNGVFSSIFWLLERFLEDFENGQKSTFWAFFWSSPAGSSGRFRPFFTKKNGQKDPFLESECDEKFLSQIDPKSRRHAELHLLKVVSFQNFPKWAIFAILAQFIEKKTHPLKNIDFIFESSISAQYQ